MPTGKPCDGLASHRVISRNTPSRLMRQWLRGHLARMQTFYRSCKKLYLIISQVSQRSNCKFVQDQWNVPHNSLVDAFSLSASSCGIKKHFSKCSEPHILCMCSKVIVEWRQITMWHWNIRQNKELSPEKCLQLKSDSMPLHFALQTT